MKYVLYFILLYLAWVFLFRLVIPVFLATRKLKKGFREMQARMEEQMKQQAASSPGPAAGPSKKEPLGDYIEFEEVK